ncbi:MAG: hypothetical protein L3J35_00350 [Bacteroidales bacterium]|nr:hypothetical protein [Bacteroidales bacterium]
MKQFSAIHFTVISLILLSLLMHYVYYSSTGSLNSPIIKYEFVKSEKDVKSIFMENNEFKKDVIEGVHNQNLVDYAYMLAYTALLFLVFMKILKHEKKIIYNIGIIFSFAAIIGDVVENIQLFRISELLVARLNFTSIVEILIIATRIKWLSLAFALFILSFYYFTKGVTGKIFAVISSLPILAAVLSVFIYIENQEIYFSYIIMSGFVALMIWTFLKKSNKSSFSFYNQNKEA